MTVEVIYLDEHEANKVAGMLGEKSSLEEQKEVLVMKKEATSLELNSYVGELFAEKNEEYRQEWESWKKFSESDSRWETTGVSAPSIPSISDDLKSLVLLTDEKEGSIPIVYLNSEESKKIAGLKGEIRSLGEQADDASSRVGMKERELRERIYAIAKERSEVYQKYTFNSGTSTQPDIRPILTDDGKAIVIRHFGPASPRSMF